MATQEDRDHAEGLRKDYERRLRVRERQKSRLGDAADPSIEIEIDQLRLNIATLNEALDAKPDDAAQEAADRLIEDNNRFLFVQAVKTNQRLAKVEERVERIDQAQNAGGLWRLQADDRLDRIEVQGIQSESKRARGSVWYRAGLLIAIAAGVLGLALAVALAVRVLS